jgi:glycosyltransferase involved in cell wall biosynthesis
MMHLFLNGLGASSGAGLTYLYNVLPQLSALPAVRTTLAVQPELRPSFDGFSNVVLADADAPAGAARRFWFEQRELPGIIRRAGTEVLISAGNFALRESPVPQILLSGNSLYTSRDFYRDLRFRCEYGMWADTRIKGGVARRSIHWAERTVAPSRAYAEELRRWTGKEVLAIHHGFDRGVFFADQSGLPDAVRQKVNAASGCLKLLFVSHYNYYRNFETLLRAIPLLRRALPGRKVRLFLTCELRAGSNPGAYNPEQATALVQQLGIREEVVELGGVPYRLLHHLYRACDIYVTPAYTETFAHPLVEAMASKLPIAAADLPVHREVCGGAARYFPRFSPDKLAETVSGIAASTEVARQLIAAEMSDAFSWRDHVKQLLEVASSIRSPRASARG